MKMIRMALMTMVLLLLPVTVFAESSNELYGNGAAKIDKTLTIQDMLTYSIQDEYMARAEYVAILAKFGTVQTFNNIKNAETTHISWLVEAFGEQKMSVPEDKGSEHIIIPESLKEAYETGVQAELDNIAMYERFLSQSIINDANNAGLKKIFDDLRRGSVNHLKAFQNQLAKY
jgi:hypothetical protein